MTKCCPRCGETKPLDGFHRDQRSRDGRQSYCRDCRQGPDRASARAWGRANAGRKRESVKSWRAANPERAWLHGITSSCREHGVPLDPAAVDYVLGLYAAPCHYCGGERAGKGNRQLDHVIPVTRGGQSTVENLVACCARCNPAKGNLTGQEYEERRS